MLTTELSKGAKAESVGLPDRLPLKVSASRHFGAAVPQL